MIDSRKYCTWHFTFYIIAVWRKIGAEESFTTCRGCSRKGRPPQRPPCPGCWGPPAGRPLWTRVREPTHPAAALSGCTRPHPPPAWAPSQTDPSVQPAGTSPCTQVAQWFIHRHICIASRHQFCTQVAQWFIHRHICTASRHQSLHTGSTVVYTQTHLYSQQAPVPAHR